MLGVSFWVIGRFAAIETLRKLYVAQHEKKPDAELVDPVPCRRLPVFDNISALEYRSENSTNEFTVLIGAVCVGSKKGWRQQQKSRPRRPG